MDCEIASDSSSSSSSSSASQSTSSFSSSSTAAANAFWLPHGLSDFQRAVGGIGGISGGVGGSVIRSHCGDPMLDL
jgi:hypothetical protein